MNRYVQKRKRKTGIIHRRHGTYFIFQSSFETFPGFNWTISIVCFYVKICVHSSHVIRNKSSFYIITDLLYDELMRVTLDMHVRNLQRFA